MTRAVLDSSVLVSAFLTPRGTSAEVLRRAERGAFALCLSDEIILETTRSLREKTRRIRRYYPEYSDTQIDRFAELLRATAELSEDLPEIRVVALDPKDDVIVATALQAKADFLVTGDRHLLSLGSHDGVRIVPPRQFLDFLSSEDALSPPEG
jgi:putative PIN family toxin of toxin-antitoxin system